MHAKPVDGDITLHYQGNTTRLHTYAFKQKLFKVWCMYILRMLAYAYRLNS